MKIELTEQTYIAMVNMMAHRDPDANIHEVMRAVATTVKEVKGLLNPSTSISHAPTLGHKSNESPTFTGTLNAGGTSPAPDPQASADPHVRLEKIQGIVSGTRMTHDQCSTPAPFPSREQIAKIEKAKIAVPGARVLYNYPFKGDVSIVL